MLNNCKGKGLLNDKNGGVENSFKLDIIKGRPIVDIACDPR
jgi:hypothetical protein